MKNQNPILLVEDDQIDALTVKRALRDIQVKNKVIHVENGEEALAYLKDNEGIKPCLIFLDLNMPRMNGIEFLEVAKNDPGMQSIPIIVLTTSTEHKDRSDSFKHSVAGYMVKPVNYDKFVEMMKTISSYWSQSEFP